MSECIDRTRKMNLKIYDLEQTISIAAQIVAIVPPKGVSADDIIRFTNIVNQQLGKIVGNTEKSRQKDGSYNFEPLCDPDDLKSAPIFERILPIITPRTTLPRDIKGRSFPSFYALATTYINGPTVPLFRGFCEPMFSEFLHSYRNTNSKIL